MRHHRKLPGVALVFLDGCEGHLTLRGRVKGLETGAPWIRAQPAAAQSFSGYLKPHDWMGNEITPFVARLPLFF